MENLKQFFDEASKTGEYWAAVLSMVLAATFFIVGTVLVYAIDGGFIIALCVFMYIAGLVALGMFFVALFSLFDKF